MGDLFTLKGLVTVVVAVVVINFLIDKIKSWKAQDRIEAQKKKTEKMQRRSQRKKR